MEAWWIIAAQISTIVLRDSALTADVCRPEPCISVPKILRLWYHEMEIDARSINVHEGDDISITCDGSCVGENYNPYLRWYGPDRYWIASEDKRHRIHVERALSPNYQKLHIRSMKKTDEGAYICRGKLGDKIGWRLKGILLYVVPKQINGDNSSAGRRINSIPTVRSTGRRHTHARTSTTQRRPPTTSRTTTPLTKPQTTETSTTTPVTSTVLTTTLSKSTRTTSTSGPTTDTVTPVFTTTSTTSAPVPSCVDGFECDNGDCIDLDYRCDNFEDCAHGEDEQNCSALSCSEKMVACDDNSRCVSTEEICDGKEDCNDGSDEFLYRCS